MTQESVIEKPVSTVEPVSPETVEKEQSQEALTEARVQQMIAEATAKAVMEAKDAGRRELQREQDRNKNADRRARLAEGKVSAYESSFGSLDEETRKEVELNRYREQDKIYQSQAQEEVQRQSQEAYFRQLDDSLKSEVEGWGIDPSDKRIDYAQDAKDYFEGRSRFTASLQKVVQEERKVAESELEKRLTAKIDETITQKAVSAGLESHDTSADSGVSGDDDAFMQMMADPNHVTTKEDLKKIDQIQKRGG